ncbi:MAG: AAA domain-containing protein [Pirellulales bacterium]
MRQWLELEAQAERERLAVRRQQRGNKDAEKYGETLVDLVISDHRSGLGGFSLITFVKRNRTLGLPWNRLRVGSPVVISDEDPNTSQEWTGVVSARNQQSIEVAFSEWPEADRFRIDLAADEVTRLRQLSAMNTAEFGKGRVAQLRNTLLGDREPQFDAEKPIEQRNKLNSSQEEAIRFALSSRDLAIIHGPPGTGKTTTVVELIDQAVQRGQRVLATAPSNAGVDNLLERLAGRKLRLVRIGHPARIQESLQCFTLDSLVESDPGTKVVGEMFKEAEQLARKAAKFTRAKPEPGARQDMRQEARQLRDDARRFERQIIANILDRADVVCATTTFDPEVLEGRTFDLGIIDEACQSTEPGCWPVVLRADRIVLAGDHCQLPPTVLSDKAAREGFSVSMMERLVHRYGKQVTRRLSIQYRMNEQIMNFSSAQFYEGELQADNSVKAHTLKDLSSIGAKAEAEPIVTMIDTAGASWDEEVEPDGESKCNVHEGKFVVEQVERLLEMGLPAEDIAVISPYSAQVRWIREKLQSTQVEVDSVDGFQGREKEAVLISLVRSNATGEIGFLADTRRMNVALTRAKRRLIIIGDSATLGGHEFYAELLHYLESINAYSTVWEYL